MINNYYTVIIVRLSYFFEKLFLIVIIHLVMYNYKMEYNLSRSRLVTTVY